MSATKARLALGSFLLVALSLMLWRPVDDPRFRFAITVLLMAAVAVLALAAQAGLQESRSSEHGRASRPEPPLPSPPSRPLVSSPPLVSPRPLVAMAPGASPSRGARRSVGYELTKVPYRSSVPRFGHGAIAQQQPWRLPVQSSPVAGVVADEAAVGDLVVRAASVVGPGHRCADPAVVRQDAYRIGRDPAGDFVVIAVADGVSSSARADLGATVAVSTAVAAVLERLRLDGGTGGLSAAELFELVASRVSGEAADRGLADRDVCAVLIVAVLPTRLRDDAPNRLWVGWLGDVSLWRLGDGRWSIAAGDRKGGDGGIESNAIAAVLPFDPGAARSEFLPLSAGDRLTLVTDGVGDGLAGLPALNRYLADEWAGPPPIADFINHVGYDAEQFTDDRTAVTVWTGEAVEGAE